MTSNDNPNANVGRFNTLLCPFNQDGTDRTFNISYFLETIANAVERLDHVELYVVCL